MTPRATRAWARCAVTISMGLAGGAAGAAEPWGGSVTVASDYVYRGVTQTDGRAALQGDLHIRSEAGWFAGLWSSTVDPPPGKFASYEVNGYAGWAREVINGWTASVSYVRYMYPDAPVHGRYDSDELSLSARFEDRFALTASWSPDAIRYSNYGWSRRGPTVAYELSLRQPVFGPVAVVGGVGYYDTSALFGASYSAWNVGVTATAGRLEFTLTRFGTDATARHLFGDYAADHRWAATATWRF